LACLGLGIADKNLLVSGLADYGVEKHPFANRRQGPQPPDRFRADPGLQAILARPLGGTRQAKTAGEKGKSDPCPKPLSFTKERPESAVRDSPILPFEDARGSWRGDGWFSGGIDPVELKGAHTHGAFPEYRLGRRMGGRSRPRCNLLIWTWLNRRIARPFTGASGGFLPACTTFNGPGGRANPGAGATTAAHSALFVVRLAAFKTRNRENPKSTPKFQLQEKDFQEGKDCIGRTRSNDPRHDDGPHGQEPGLRRRRATMTM